MNYVIDSFRSGWTDADSKAILVVDTENVRGPVDSNDFVFIHYSEFRVDVSQTGFICKDATERRIHAFRQKLIDSIRIKKGPTLVFYSTDKLTEADRAIISSKVRELSLPGYPENRIHAYPRGLGHGASAEMLRQLQTFAQTLGLEVGAALGDASLKRVEKLEHSNDLFWTLRLLLEAWLLRNWGKHGAYDRVTKLKSRLQIQDGLPVGCERLNTPETSDEWLTHLRGDKRQTTDEIVEAFPSETREAVRHFFKTIDSTKDQFPAFAELFLTLDARSPKPK